MSSWILGNYGAHNLSDEELGMISLLSDDLLRLHEPSSQHDRKRKREGAERIACALVVAMRDDAYKAPKY